MRLLIVDDEWHIVEYMKHIVAWEKDYHVQTIIGLSSGIEAKEVLIKENPDLLITDIRMPEVSGLDLVEFIKEQGLQTKAIILSGFTDFEYARQALRFNVVDYLVKPVIRQDLEPVLEKIWKQLYLRKQNFEELNTTELWLSLIGIETELTPQYEALIQSNFTDTYQWPTSNSEQQPNISLVFRNQTLELVWNGHATVFPIELQQMTQRKFRDAIFSMQENWQPQVFSMPILPLIRSKKDDAEKHGAESTQLFLSVLQSIYQKEPELIKNLSFSQLWTWREQQLTPDWESLEKQAYQYFDQLSGSEYTIQMVKDYIDLNFDQSLSQEKLGALVHLHPVYLARIFKNETGETINNYLTKVRLKKAAELLIDSQLRVSDINQLVGYHKTQYFIKIFKKEFGLTPQQYRKVKEMHRSV